MSLLGVSSLHAVPWKNGLGTTRELAIYPSGADTESFLWRISIADVTDAAPFSSFPGVDRSITLLEGAGFIMTLDGAREHALTTA
jgi:environmental stress-induced protein Ves